MLEMNDQIRLRSNNPPSIIWLVVPWKSWERKTWDRVQEVQITPCASFWDSRDVLDGIETHLVQVAINTIRESLAHEPRVKTMERSSVDQIRSYEDLTQFVDETFYYLEVDNLPEEASPETCEALERLRDFYDLQPIEGDLKIVRGKCENPDMTIIQSEDRMPSDNDFHEPEVRPSVNLCRRLEKSIEDSDLSWRVSNDIEDAVNDLRHAQQLEAREIHLVKDRLSEVKTPVVDYLTQVLN